MQLQKPFVSEKIWGYERWIVSTHAAGQSVTAAGGNTLKDVLGYDYPLLLKVIQADDKLSVQLHPDDAYAKKHENSLGKTECWYVLDAKEGASLVCGLSGDYSAEELRTAISENRLEPYLRSVNVKKGDFLFIPAGLVHAIGGGLRLLEIQESSDITYRLYDWGRGREVHIEKGLEVLKHLASDVQSGFCGPFDCEYFSLRLIDTKATGKAEISGITGQADTAYSLFVLDCSPGAALTGKTGETLLVKTEDTLVCDPDETVTASGDMRVMQIIATSMLPRVC
ncbi:MAG: hypothetical protein Ta2A_21300 [Treponemataceae bacterium]|nr:MAG: hypothetical protein Ta2A_21300 [Treponemataceae bacterium]